MLLLLLNYVVLRALWKIDVYLISTLVSLYYYYYFHSLYLSMYILYTFSIFKKVSFFCFCLICVCFLGGGGQEVGVSNDYTIITVSDAVTRHSRYIVEKST